MLNKISIFSFIIPLLLMLFSCLDHHDLNNPEPFPYSIISETKESSEKKGFYIADYDLTIYTALDTIVFTNYGWLEKEWFQKHDDNNNVYFEASEKRQLVFPLNSAFCDLNKVSVDHKFEIVDAKWQYTSAMGLMRGFKLDGSQKPEQLTLFTELNGIRVNTLIFTLSNY